MPAGEIDLMIVRYINVLKKKTLKINSSIQGINTRPKKYIKKVTGKNIDTLYSYLLVFHQTQF